MNHRAVLPALSWLILGSFFWPAAFAEAGSFQNAASLLTPRRAHTATLLQNGKVLVVGGLVTNQNQSEGLATAELYDPATGSWAFTGSLSGARYGHSATLLADGTVLVAGGTNLNDVLVGSAEIYNPATGLWHSVGNLTTARRAHSASLLPSGKVLVAGGNL